MKYTKLGKSDLIVSHICMGCMVPMGMPAAYMSSYTPISASSVSTYSSRSGISLAPVFAVRVYSRGIMAQPETSAAISASAVASSSIFFMSVPSVIRSVVRSILNERASSVLWTRQERAGFPVLLKKWKLSLHRSPAPVKTAAAGAFGAGRNDINCR